MTLIDDQNDQEKKVVSPFEMYFMALCEPEKAKNYRAETAEEKSSRLQQGFSDYLSQAKIKNK